MMELQNVRRRILFSAVCAICHENGFDYAERPVIETLCEMLQSLICEIGRTSQAYCEHSGRTQPNIADVDIALIVLGINIDSIPEFGKRPEKITIPPPTQAPKPPVPKILQAGEKKTHSFYIPDYFPPFPDPHAYIRTPTYKQPVTEYEAIREKSASQKRDVERALTRFMAKTCETSLSHSLFPDENMAPIFPLIDLRIQPNAYVHALLPKDQIFEDDEEEEKEKQKTPPIELPEGNTEESEKDQPIEGTTVDNEVPDNPYLREAKPFYTSNI